MIHRILLGSVLIFLASLVPSMAQDKGLATGHTPKSWPGRADQIREAMQQVMGKLPPPTHLPLDVRVASEVRLRHYTRQHISFLAEKGDRIPGYLLIPHGSDGKPPRSGKLFGVVCLPGSSSPGKDVPSGLTTDLDRAFAHDLAERGFVCLVLDYPVRHTNEYKTDPYAIGYVSATMKGIVNHRRGVDLLRSLPYVDPEAIAAAGHSLGGHNSLFLAAFDPRVKVAVTSCGFNAFAKYMKGNLAGWSSKYYMPRIKSVHGDDPKKMPFDFDGILAVIAPRAVFVNAPIEDSNFEVSGVRDCIDRAMPVFRDVFGKPENLEVHYPNAGHTFPVEQRLAAFDFLERNLGHGAEKVDLKESLLGHWPLGADTRDHGGKGWHAIAKHTHPAAGVAGKAKSATAFDGARTFLEIPAQATATLATGDFTLSSWMYTDSSPEVPMTLLSQYDPARHRGFHLSLQTSSGVTLSQPSARHLQFGIDNGHSSDWVDCGRPGEAILAFALATHGGQLYAGTCESGKEQAGRVYRHAGGTTWLDCGAPAKCNAVTSLAVFEGKLYAGVGKYRLAGSALKESENPHLGGRIYRFLGGKKWADCGALPGAEAIGGMVVFRGQLYASSLYKPASFHRYAGGDRWIDCGTPDGKRVGALTVFGDNLYASSYDGGHVYRYDGKAWTDLGALGTNTQTYSFVNYQGKLHVGTWPSGRVYRLEEDRWIDTGRLGEELEVMGMHVHNGRLLAGTLPLAEVHEYEADGRWKRLTQLDRTPEVRYRRAWTMAEHDGRLFCATLPSGHVHALEAGRTASFEHELTPGWHHVAAVRSGDRCLLYLDGRLAVRSTSFAPSEYDLTSGQPLRVGLGPSGYFRGRLADLRLYGRALNAAEVRQLTQAKAK